MELDNLTLSEETQTKKGKLCTFPLVYVPYLES